MKYTLNGCNDHNNILRTVLNNRGIEDWLEYMSLESNTADDFNDLDNVQDAVDMLLQHLDNRNTIAILSDCDVDGVCSAVIMHQYIKYLEGADYPVEIMVHENNKAHGLSNKDFVMPTNTKLLIVPDAGTNDVSEINEFVDNGIDVIILDHHMKTQEYSGNAVIVNNQCSHAYANKDACGAHVTYNFLQAVDEALMNYFCDSNFTDLVALADISDVMSLKSPNTRAMVNTGLHSIQNKMLKAIIESQSFSMKGIINPHTIAFYVTPMINAFIRLASKEERELLIRAFCEDESETFGYKKRGTDTVIQESIYSHVVRLMKSYRGKQNRARDKAFQEIMRIASSTDSDDKVAIIDATGMFDNSLTGLIAIKVSEELHKPTLIVRQTANGMSGSGRAFNYCPVNDFRGLMEQCPHTIFAQGHASAFGVSISDVPQAQKWLNSCNELKDIDFEKVYDVDFVIDSQDLTIKMCSEVFNMQNVWGHGVDEPLWAIKNIKVNGNNAKICGSKQDTIQIYNSNIGATYVMFRCASDNALMQWLEDNWGDEEITIEAVGTLTLNSYNGEMYPQFIIKDFNVLD